MSVIIIPMNALVASLGIAVFILAVMVGCLSVWVAHISRQLRMVRMLTGVLLLDSLAREKELEQHEHTS